MKKLRFKNRNGILYFGIDGKFTSSKLKYTNINKNIIIGKFKDGRLNEDLGLESNSQTVTELLKEVIESKSVFVKDRTVATYNQSAKNWIIPYFKDIDVRNVKPIDIKKFQDSFIKKGLGNGSVNIARTLLKDVFEYAILKELISINPVVMVSLPKTKKEKEKINPFTMDEIDLLLENASVVLRNFLGISFFTGMRSGELLSLKWSDVDFDTDTISITKTISNGDIGSPKNYSSIRDIELLPYAKEYFIAQRLETGLKDSYVFLNKKGGYHPTNQFFYKGLQKLLRSLQIDTRSLHHTRHTFASMMLNNKIEIIWVSAMLGHSNIQMTLKVYAHYMPKKEKMSVGFLDDRYKRGTKIGTVGS